jgi:polyisoprenoid-binding protein YceI
MKNVGFSLLLTALFAVTSFAATGPVTPIKVDVASSYIVWKGYKVTGSHYGKIKIKSGALEFNEGVLTGGTFEIDMTSITCDDLTGGSNEKLVGHLKSDDFFGSATHPVSTFKITSVTPKGTPGDYKIVGDLTIKGITEQVKFYANVTEADGQIKASGDVTVDRSLYNVRFGSNSFFGNLGDKTIYDDFELTVNLVANK